MPAGWPGLGSIAGWPQPAQIAQKAITAKKPEVLGFIALEALIDVNCNGTDVPSRRAGSIGTRREGNFAA